MFERFYYKTVSTNVTQNSILMIFTNNVNKSALILHRRLTT